MSWIRVDDKAPGHPKFLAAGPVASWLWVCGQGYCASYLTDGFIPAAALPTFPVPDVLTHAATLVRVGLWEAVEDGYQVHDYLDYQPSKTQVVERRRMDAERKRDGGHEDSGRNPRGIHTESENPPRARAGTHPIPSHPIPTDPDRSAETAHADGNGQPPDMQQVRFDLFWAVYPRKVGKGAARGEWRRLHPSDELTNIIVAAVQAQARQEQWRRESGRYVPNPATWLHQGRWDDELAGASAPPEDTGPCPRCGNPAGRCATTAACDLRYLNAKRAQRGAPPLEAA